MRIIVVSATGLLAMVSSWTTTLVVIEATPKSENGMM